MISKDIKISVVIPVFNSENTISACLDSVLLQSVKEIEVIVIDDGSIDNTYDLVKKRAEDDRRIVLIKQKNAGPSAARNKGIQQARGEFINFVDADDIIFPEMFRSLLLYEKKYAADFVISGMRKVIKKREKTKIVDVKPDKIYYFSDKNKIKNHFIKILNMEALNNPVGRIYRTEIVKKNDLYFDEELDMGEDLRFNIEYLDKIKSILILPEIYYQYNIFNSTLTFKYRENLFDKRKKNLVLLEKFAKKYGIEENFIYYFYIKLVYATAMQEIEHGGGIQKRYYVIKRVINSPEVRNAVKKYLPEKRAEKIMHKVVKIRSAQLIDMLSIVFVMVRKNGIFYNHRISV